MPNKHKWHILVLPEDDATKQLGNGLARAFPAVENRVQVLREARGWEHAMDMIPSLDLKKYVQRRVLLIIDFDKDGNRLNFIKSKPFVVPFSDRIYVIGCFDEAERLKNLVGENNLERVGERLGTDCNYWSSPLLANCKSDACRLKNEIQNIND